MPGGEEDHDQPDSPHDIEGDDVFDCKHIPLSASPFKDHFEQLRTKANQAMKNTNDTGINNYHAETILNID